MLVTHSELKLSTVKLLLHLSDAFTSADLLVRTALKQGSLWETPWKGNSDPGLC